MDAYWVKADPIPEGHLLPPSSSPLPHPLAIYSSTKEKVDFSLLSPEHFLSDCGIRSLGTSLGSARGTALTALASAAEQPRDPGRSPVR